jgi:hypothetical protein
MNKVSVLEKTQDPAGRYTFLFRVSQSFGYFRILAGHPAPWGEKEKSYGPIPKRGSLQANLLLGQYLPQGVNAAKVKTT